jgi:hypothetical protein
MLQRKIVSCYNTWRAQAVESKRLKNMCKRVAARWHKASLFRIIHQWVDATRQQQEDREVVQRWMSSVLNRELSAAYRKWTSVVRDLSNDDRLADLEAMWEQSNQAKVESEAYKQTELIRDRNNQLRHEMGQRDALVDNLRRQLPSQTKVGDHMAELAKELARTKKERNKLQDELRKSRNEFDVHVTELQGQSNSKLTNLETEVLIEKQQFAEQMLEERTVWIKRVMSMEEKIDRAKDIMQSRKNTIISLREDFKEKKDTVDELQKLNRASELKINELRFRLRECVIDQKSYVKRQQAIEAARIKREAEHPTSQRLDQLELVVGQQLKRLTNHLDGCSETVEIMKKLDEFQKSEQEL